jgi:hypothetical protein
MSPELWCRVTVMGPHHVALASCRLEGPALPDLRTVDDVARLALLAKRFGGAIVLADVAPALRALLELSGLCVEVQRQAESREESFGVEQGQEEAHPDDLTL